MIKISIIKKFPAKKIENAVKKVRKLQPMSVQLINTISVKTQITHLQEILKLSQKVLKIMLLLSDFLY